jgi:CheY-like chemotaxis protein
MKPDQTHTTLNILLADDDRDDRFFFKKALEELSIPTNFATVEDGEQLMKYLLKNIEHLPDILFLDLNMPRKTGIECLEEIKLQKNLGQLPVIIYSTSLIDSVADMLYKKGAHYYLRKRDLHELIKTLEDLFALMIKNQFARPTRKEFILSEVKHLT